MSKLRVLQFITPAGFYGAERWVLALANNINSNEIVCDLAVTQEGGNQDLSVATHYPKEAGEVHYLKMQGRFDLRVVKQLTRVIRERKIDVIHSHGYKSDILGFMAARLTGIKCVSTPHGFSSSVDFKLAAFIKLGTFMLRYFDRVVPLSDELVADMKRMKVPDRITQFVRNGVDLKEIDGVIANLDPSSLPAKTKNRVGFIGQMIPRKGIPDLLQVFDLLHQANPNLQLQLLGDGHQRPELEQLAQSLQCQSDIEFLGFREDRLALLSQFDLFVMTSSLEGIPRCMMEAMAVGVPCVAYDIPGVDQLIEHNETGLLAPHGDKEKLRQSCEALLNDDALAATLVANARKKIDDQYSAGRMAREYESIFCKLLGMESLASERAGGVS